MSNANSQNPFPLGKWLVRPLEDELVIGTKVLRIEQKVMQVLVLLASRSGDVVSREELLAAVWPNNSVNEETLTRCVSILRKAFSTEGSVRIHTLRNQGYRLFVVSATKSYSWPRIASRFPSFQKIAFPLVLLVISLILGFKFNLFSAEEHSPRWNKIPLLTSKLDERYPEISPDGSRIVFCKYTNSKSGDDIYLKIREGNGATLQLTNSPGNDVSPTWSPDGRFIAYLGKSNQGLGIYSVSALGGDIRKIGNSKSGLVEKMAWSADGQYIAYTDRASKQEAFSIYMMEAATGISRQLTRPTHQHWGDYFPSFSPDGSQMSFIRGISAGTHDVHIIDLNSEAEKRLTFETRRTLGQIWAADGNHIIFSAASGRTGFLREIPVTGGVSTALEIPGRRPSINDSGEFLLVEDWEHDYDIIKISKDKGDYVRDGMPALNSSYEDFSPSVSPDGSKIAFVSNRSGYYEAWTLDFASGESKAVTDLAANYLSSVSWSPDGTMLLATVFTRDGNADVALIDPSRRKTDILLSTVFNEMAPKWADNNSIYFSSNRTGRYEIWQYDLRQATSEQVTIDGGFAVLPAPVKNQIFFAKYDSTGIWLQSLSTGRVQQVVNDLHLFDWANFALSNNELIYFSRPSAWARTSLRSYNLTSHAKDSLLSLSSLPPVPGLVVAAGHGEYYLTQSVKDDVDVVLYSRN